MTNSSDSQHMELEADALGNMAIDFPERLVQERMVKDINTLLAKGSTPEQATDWVFGNREHYEADETFGVDSARSIQGDKR